MQGELVPVERLDLVYRPNTTYVCVYCGEDFVGNDSYRDIYRCDRHLLDSSERPVSGGTNNPAMIRRYYMHRKKIPKPIREKFPLVADIVQNATELTRCRFPDMGAHTHKSIYRICIPGVANPALWNSDYHPTSLMLDAYEHLVS